MIKALNDSFLYTFIDTAYLRKRSVQTIAQQLCDGGSDLIQLRAKHSTVDEVCRLAEAILPITEKAGVGLVINDHWSAALKVGAPFCHLGQEDFFDAGYSHSSQLPSATEAVRLGLSSHSSAQAQRAVKAGAAYLGVGPIFATPTKPSATPVTLDYVRWAAEHLTIPWFAIGGINLTTLDPVLEAGAQRICVVSAILNADDMVKVCLAFKSRLQPGCCHSKTKIKL